MTSFDDLEFGPQRTLNLRESLPTAAEATTRTDRWLREQQIRGSREVLVITGRGNHSIGGVPVVKEAVLRLLRSLKRQGVVAGHREQNPGAVIVTLASLRTLADAPMRRREPVRASPSFEFRGLEAETIGLLRQLAEASLAALAITADDARVRDEMHRQLGVISSAVPQGGASEDQLRETLRTMIAEYD